MSLSFKPELMEKVLSGDKTVTRRKWPTNYREGQIVSICPGMGRIACGRVRLTSVFPGQLHPFEPSEARREGFETFEDFKAYWIDLYGDFPEPGYEDFTVARIEFELIETFRTICECCGGIGTLPRNVSPTDHRGCAAAQSTFGGCRMTPPTQTEGEK